MERKDLTPSDEMLLNEYNNTHKTKIEPEKVKRIQIKGKKLYIDYLTENTFLGYSTVTMDITLTDDDVIEYDRRKYHRAIELVAQAINRDLSPFDDGFIYAQDIPHLEYIYNNYTELIDNYIVFTVSDVSEGLVEVDTSYNNIFCAGDKVSFYDLKGNKHKLNFEWFLSPEHAELKEYFSNWEKVEKREKIDKCKDDIETYKRLIVEREEELKKLEEEEN